MRTHEIGDLVIYGDKEGSYKVLGKIISFESTSTFINDVLFLSYTYTPYLGTNYPMSSDEEIFENCGNITIDEFKEKYPEELI